MSWCIKDKIWLFFRIWFFIEVSGILLKIVRSRHCSLCSSSACCPLLSFQATGNASVLVSWRKITWGEGTSCVKSKCRYEMRRLPQLKVDKSTLWDEHFLRNLTSISPFYHSENLSFKKQFRCLLLLREKGCFLLYKAASYVFWYTIVWTSVFSW